MYLKILSQFFLNLKSLVNFRIVHRFVCVWERDREREMRERKKETLSNRIHKIIYMYIYIQLNFIDCLENFWSYLIHLFYLPVIWLGSSHRYFVCGFRFFSQNSNYEHNLNPVMLSKGFFWLTYLCCARKCRHWISNHIFLDCAGILLLYLLSCLGKICGWKTLNELGFYIRVDIQSLEHSAPYPIFSEFKHAISVNDV